MIKIDCFGDICPVPILKIKENIPKLLEGETLEVVSDHSCSVENIKDTFKKYNIEVDEVMNGVWEIKISL